MVTYVYFYLYILFSQMGIPLLQVYIPYTLHYIPYTTHMIAANKNKQWSWFIIYIYELVFLLLYFIFWNGYTFAPSICCIYPTLHTLHSTLHTLHYIPYTTYPALHTLHYIPYTPQIKFCIYIVDIIHIYKFAFLFLYFIFFKM